jgi:hypothetical protein
MPSSRYPETIRRSAACRRKSRPSSPMPSAARSSSSAESRPRPAPQSAWAQAIIQARISSISSGANVPSAGVLK